LAGCVLLGLVCALLSWLGTRPTLFQGLEEWLQDACFHVRGTRPTGAHIVVIGLDEPSLDELRKPRLYLSPELAEVVTFVHRQGAAAIGLDVIIPDSGSGLPELQRGGPGDATRMGDAIAAAGNVVLAQWHVEGTWIMPLIRWQLQHQRDPQPTDLGFVNVTADADHFLRRQMLYVRDDDDQPLMHFALALYSRATGAEVAWRDGRLWVAGQAVPLDDEQALRVNFVGPPGAFPVAEGPLPSSAVPRKLRSQP
jgi:CHASE2 domain-containing sensor protein